MLLFPCSLKPLGGARYSFYEKVWKSDSHRNTLFRSPLVLMPVSSKWRPIRVNDVTDDYQGCYMNFKKEATQLESVH